MKNLQYVDKSMFGKNFVTWITTLSPHPLGSNKKQLLRHEAFGSNFYNRCGMHTWFQTCSKLLSTYFNK